jgi:hypothetical protein
MRALSCVPFAWVSRFRSRAVPPHARPGRACPQRAHGAPGRGADPPSSLRIRVHRRLSVLLLRPGEPETAPAGQCYSGPGRPLPFRPGGNGITFIYNWLHVLRGITVRPVSTAVAVELRASPVPRPGGRACLNYNNHQPIRCEQPVAARSPLCGTSTTAIDSEKWICAQHSNRPGIEKFCRNSCL